MDKWTHPHQLIGNGMHLPCAALALLAGLLSVELIEACAPYVDC
jgi:hypothetical protein